MSTPPTAAPASREAIRSGLLAYLDIIAQGGEPFGPPLPGLPRRSHSLAIPDLPGAAPDEGVPAAPPPLPAWPELPLDTTGRRRLDPSQVERAIQALLATPELAGAEAGAGLTPARLRGALAAAGFDASTIGRVLPFLAIWLARAGALALPADADTPWASPRRLTLTDAAAIRARLRAFPPPTPEDVADERIQGLK